MKSILNLNVKNHLKSTFNNNVKREIRSTRAIHRIGEDMHLEIVKI